MKTFLSLALACGLVTLGGCSSDPEYRIEGPKATDLAEAGNQSSGAPSQPSSDPQGFTGGKAPAPDRGR